MSNGSAVEREFINLLSDEHGYACLRAPGSGGATDRDRPDAVALRAGKMDPDAGFAVELKKRPDGTVRFETAEIDALERWARRAGVEPFVVVKPDLRTFDHWLVMHTSNLHETETGYSIRKQDHERCRSISEVFA
jgi:Holliday junction resolvase